MDTDDFLTEIDSDSLKTIDRAHALLWWAGRDDRSAGMTAKEICEVLERHGHPRQNRTRLRDRLKVDRAVGKGKDDTFRLHPRKRSELDQQYGSLASGTKRPRPSDSVVPRELFDRTRGYIEKIVYQLNASYDYGLYDCCAVMCRRLLETLIIETYEAQGRAKEIKGADNNFLMFGGLLAYLEADSEIHIGRAAMSALRDFKKLGDLSAHNRRFNARQNDIDRIRDGLRVASEELLHLSELVK